MTSKGPLKGEQEQFRRHLAPTDASLKTEKILFPFHRVSHNATIIYNSNDFVKPFFKFFQKYSKKLTKQTKITARL